MNDIRDEILQNSFLQFLDDFDQKDLIRKGEFRDLPAGQPVTVSFGRRKFLHLVLEGVVSTHQSQIDEQFEPGDVVNIESFLLGTHYTQTTFTTTPARILFIPTDDVAKFFMNNPEAFQKIKEWKSLRVEGNITVIDEQLSKTVLTNITERAERNKTETDLISEESDEVFDEKTSVTKIQTQTDIEPQADDEEEKEEELPDAPPGDVAGEDYVKPDLKHFLKEGSKRKAPMEKPQIVRQHDQMDCGAACLSMVAKAYGKNISLATYRSIIHITREGASMWSLLRAAEKTGIRAMGCKTNWDGLGEAHLPVVILAQYHFMVVFKVNKLYAVVGDPAYGIRRIPKPILEQVWQGMTLLFRPTSKFYRQEDSVPTFKKYLELMRDKWVAISEVFGAAFLVFLFGLVTPLFTQVTFDTVFVKKDMGLLNILLVTMIAVALFKLIVGSVQQYLITHLAHRFDANLSSLFYRHTLRLPLKFFMVRRVGDFITRFSEILKIRQFFLGDTIQTVINLISIFLYGAVIYLYNLKLGLLVTALTPLVFTFSFLLGRWLQRAHAELFTESAKAQSHVLEHFRSMETVQALNAEIPARWRWEEVFRKVLRIRFKLNKMNIFLSLSSEGAQSLFAIGVLYYAATMGLEGILTVGQVIATAQFVSMIFGPVHQLAEKWNSLQETRVAFERVDDIFTALPEGKGARNTKDLPKTIQGEIEFKDVWFQYGSDLSPWVIKGVNLKITPGETVAIVGRSGSGKTTLAQMINGLYAPVRGQILIDGRDQIEYPTNYLRTHIGIVMQDNQIFSGSILKNIAYGDESPSLDKASTSAKIANAYEFVKGLPQGFESELEEGGTGISGGQKQRLGIARALYRDPDVLILDEATSSLDSQSEQSIVQELKEFSADKTTIIIAHRLSTIKYADRIVLMDNGRVVEDGKYEELIASQGKFYELFGQQIEI